MNDDPLPPTAAANPYSFGTMITDPARFAGRRAELETIMARLNGQQSEGSAIVGPRRIGKSSLLHYLYRPRPDDPLRLQDGIELFYLDVADGRCATRDQFRALLLALLLARTPLDRRRQPDRDLAQLRQATQARNGATWQEARTVLENLPFRPVICLDEVEGLLTIAGVDNRFFNGLRNWANDGLVTWITASARPLEELAEMHSLTSPFFNVLGRVPLGDLTGAETAELIGWADQTSYPFSAPEQTVIRRWAGHNPYWLQIVCWRLWEMKKSGQVNLKELRAYLCQQTPAAPPPACRRSAVSPRIVWPLLSLFLLAALLVVAYLWVPGASELAGTLLTGLRRIWTGLGSLGDGVGGIVVVVAIIAAALAFWRRRSLKAAACEFWQRVS
jgi:hypothetical protein